MATAEELAARIEALTARPAAPAPPSTAEDVGMSTASGGARALAALLGMPADTLNFLSRNIQQGLIPFFPTAGVPNLPPRPPTLSTLVTGEPRTVPPVQLPGGAADVQSVARNIPGAGTLFDYQPTTDAGRYVRTGTEWALPAVIGGPGGLLRRLLTGFAGGEAAQGATDLSHRVVPERFRNVTDPAIGLITGLLTMTGLNRPTLNRTNPSTVVREATAHVPPAGWQRAERRIQDLDDAQAAAGIPEAQRARLLPAEALGAEGATLQGITSDVAASRQGAPVQQAMANRGPPMVAAAEDMTARFGGPRRSTADVAQDVSEGARNVIGEAGAARTQASRPYYHAAEFEQVPLASFTPIIRNINDRIARVGEDSVVGRSLVDLRDRLIAGSSGTNVNVGPVSMLARETRDGLYPRAPGQSANAIEPRMMTRTEQGVIGPYVDEITETLERLNPNFRTAQDLYRTNSPRINALEQPNVMGNLQAPVTPSTNTNAMLADQARILTGEGVTPAQINRVFGELSMSSQPQAARDLAARLLYNELDTAARRVASAPDAPMSGARFAAALLENPDVARRTEAIIRNMARTNGQNPDIAWRGFHRMLDAFTQTGRIPPIGSRTNPRAQLDRSMGDNWVSRIADTVNITRGSLLPSISSGASRFTARADYAALADALSGAGGIQLLRDMAGQIPNSPRAQQMLTRALEAARQAGELQQDQR